MPITLDRGDTFCTIRLDGEININAAAELKAILLQALAMDVDQRVNAQDARDIDITALQLIWAAKREAGVLGRSLLWNVDTPEAIVASANNVGMTLPMGAA